MPRMRAKATIAALPSVIKQQFEKEAYRHYTADALKVIAENTGILTQGHGTQIAVRYAELIDPTPEDSRTEEEIVAHVLRRGWGGEDSERI